MAMTREITVVVPTKNEARRLGKCLASLQDQTVPPREILVVDGHSEDGTAEVAQRHGVRVVYEDYGTRAGACQVGVEAAQGSLIAFTDADCVPHPTWLESLEAALEADVMGVGGRIVNEGGAFWERAVDAALDTLVGSANSVQGRVFREKRYVSSVSGCNSLYRRADLLAVGGFRTDLLTAEDTELNARLRDHGRLLYIPDAVVYHRHGRGLRDFARRMYQYGFGRGQSLLLGPPLLIPLGLPAVLLTTLLWPVIAAALLGAYLVVLLLSSISASWRRRNPRLLAALPLVYVTEHLAYTAGFWSALVRRPSPAFRPEAANEGDES